MAGVIQAIDIIAVDESGTAIYQMTISSEGNDYQEFHFSVSYAPAFFVDQDSPSELTEKILTAQNTTPSFDPLSVGLDTPPRVAEYKNRLRSQTVVVFYDQEYPLHYPFHEFSRSYRKPIVLNGEIWPSVDHYVEAQKFADSRLGFYYSLAHAMSVRVAPSPTTEAANRPISIRSDWEDVKDKIMFDALVAKFTQHKDLYDLLISTRDTPIVEHTEDRYWGDGEDGTGRSMSGNFLTEVSIQLQEGLVPEYGHPKIVFPIFPNNHPHADGVIAYPPSLVGRWNQLRIEIESVNLQPRNDVQDIVEQIASSNISDVEKVDRMQMILHSKHFFERKARQWHGSIEARENQTSASEWVAFIEQKYSEDTEFKYQLIKTGVLLAGTMVEPTDLSHVNIPYHQKLNVYQMMVRSSPTDFIETLLSLNLNHSDTGGLYLYALEFEALLVVYYMRKLPRDIVDDLFIQRVINILNKSRFYSLDAYFTQTHLEVRSRVTQELIEAAAFHGLNYKSNNFDEPSARMEDPVQLILISDTTFL